MKLREIFCFELAYQVRRPWPWLFFLVLLVLDFLMARDTSLSDALYEDFYANSPFSIAKTTVVGSLIWLVMAAAIAGEAAARDVATRMHPLIYTTPVSRVSYLAGRFLAALVLNASILLAVQAGILLGVYSPGVSAGVTGPFRPAAYLTAYAFISLPNAFVATALQFSLAVRGGRAMAGYLGSFFLVFMGFFVASLLLFKQGMGTLLDPVGIRFIVEDLSHQWTTVEKNVRLVKPEGPVLGNRLVWSGIALAVLASTYLGFRFAHHTGSTWWRRGNRRRSAHAPVPAVTGIAAGRAGPVLKFSRSSGFVLQVRQTLAVAGISFRAIATSWAGLTLLAVIPLLTVPVVLDQMESMGTPLVPATAHVIRELTAPLSAELSRWVIIPLFILFFAGELVWREREAGMGELTDSMPGPDWAPFLGKFLALGLVLAVFMTLLMAAGMLAQVIMGYQHFETGLYLKILFGLQLPEYLLFALPAFLVHVLANQKYTGHMMAVLVYAFIAVLATMLGIGHNLLVYGAGPGWAYTYMRGFGSSLGPWVWFKLYWAAWALLLAVVTRLLWVRGREGGFGVRLRLARRRFTRSTAWIAGVAVVLVLATGGFIFYNTNMLNEYLSSSAIASRRAGYERRYRQYDRIPQPQMTGTSLQVEIYPEQQTVRISGSYRLVNNNALPVGSILVATATGGVETRVITFDRKATLAVDDKAYSQRIYTLARPLQPGDSLQLRFEVLVQPHGFRNQGVDPSVMAGGTYFTNAAWFPAIGYQRTRELVSAADRRAYGLPPRPVIASLYEAEGREPAKRGGGISFEAVVGTDGEQVAVAPGALRRTWARGGRRYFHYVADAPIGEQWAFFSAHYVVQETVWKGIVIRVFRHPGDTAHLDRLMQSVRASLDYYTEQFGPYPYRHLSIVEQPGAPGSGLHAEPGLISHGEGFPSWIPETQQSFDLPYAVVAHEMAHQWTVSYALVEGAPFLSEGLAWYSAMQVVKKSRGEEELQRLLAFMRQPYPFRPIRRGEPLLRALDPYLSYRKGPFAMYALSEYIGPDRVNQALRQLIGQHDPAGGPLATTLDLYRGLQAVTPDSLRYLLHDLFEVNTYWKLETKNATAKQTEAGTWEVTLDVLARKTVVDSAGSEKEVTMDDWMEIAVFAPAGADVKAGQPLYAQKHRIRSGGQQITVTVPRKPDRAGIDPRYLLNDPETKGSSRKVQVKN